MSKQNYIQKSDDEYTVHARIITGTIGCGRFFPQNVQNVEKKTTNQIISL